MELKLHGTIFAQLMRLVSGKRWCRYPDEIDPSLWKKAMRQDTPEQSNLSVDVSNKEVQNEKDPEAQNGVLQNEKLQQGVRDNNGKREIFLVDWYGPDDPENPQNWPNGLKHLIAFQMCILNFAVYIASSMYTPGESDLMKEFGVSQEVATLGLSLFTVGYGIGPMLWSPLSEMPKLGRSGIFFWTLLAFILFQLAVGFAPNITVFLVFRWVTGFCGSPCLATGGGTINDIYNPILVPYLLCIWASAGVCGPVFGPIIGGYLAPAKGWRWTIWCFTWLCSLVLITMFFLFPETSAANILYNRAKRLRIQTGDDRWRSQSEIDSEHHTTKDTLIMVSRAFILTFSEPIVLLINLYAGLLYGVLFLWFESFPLVFGGIYGFTISQQGLVFLAIFIFACISVACFLLWTKYVLVPKLKSGTFKPEMVLPPTFIGCFALPACLFWFGWSSRSGVHWIVPTIGSGLFSIGVVTLFNSLYNYLAIMYAQYSASIFAGAALFRALFGATFPLFAGPLFSRLGIGPANSLLGGIAILFIPVPFVFYHYGENIRGWSKRGGS